MKNPWLSLWLSGANAWSGAARGMIAAEGKRAQNAMMREAARQAAEFWLLNPMAGSKPRTPTSKPRASARRRRAR